MPGLTKYVVVDITPEETAVMFERLTPEERIRFFNYLGDIYCGGSETKAARFEDSQREILQSKELTPEGRDFIACLHPTYTFQTQVTQ